MPAESPWRNTTDRNRAAWGALPGPKGFIRIYRGKYSPNPWDTVSKLGFVIPCLVDCSKLVISPPTAREELDERLPAPWNFLISGISKEALDHLTSTCFWSTPTISFFVFPFDLPLPNYICTLQFFSLPDSVETNNIIADAVKAKLKSIKEATEYLTKHIEGNNPKDAMSVIDSIEVKSLEIAIANGGTDVVWHVYCKPHSSLSFPSGKTSFGNFPRFGSPVW
ncbi:hypothetical protein C8J57DRAFT_1601241 [Mycena rebaudengoi]|nr:hypothetical protein C8J57DRAFT_1601241 [Mycena rebaudengoi]